MSYAIRRDLHDPLRFFEVLRPIHFYRHASYADMTEEEKEGSHRFTSSAELFAKLEQASPQIVQGGEPFVRRLVPTTWAVLAYSKLRHRPYVVPSVDNLPIAGKYGGLWATALRAAVRPYVRSASLAIAPNRAAEDNLRWAGARPERLTRMMYGTWGVDTTEFSPEGQKTALPLGDPAIVCLGRLDRSKGIFDLVAAMPKILSTTNANLIFIGDGPDREELEAQVARTRFADHVAFLGSVKNRDVPSYLRAATVLAMPSRTTQRWAEQVGMSAIQAMACGVPVVSTTSGSIPEFVDDGVSGILVPEGDVDALATALTRLLTNRELLGRLARQAREQAVERYDARTNIRAIERRILEACGFAT